MKPLEDYLKPTQKELFARLRTYYKGHINVCKNSYIIRSSFSLHSGV